MKAAKAIDAASVRAAVLRHLEPRLVSCGIAPASVDDEFDLVDRGVLDSFAFVEVFAGVTDDLDLQLDLDDLTDGSFSTVGEITGSFLQAARALERPASG